MKHSLFLFDLDDTLLDFKASEQLSFVRTMQLLGVADIDTLFAKYQEINAALWRALEQGQVTLAHLKVERFRASFAACGIELDGEKAAKLYLESLTDTVVLNDGALALCEELAGIGEVGIITNGVQQVQQRRIESAGLLPYVSFISTSEACGCAKPDPRFFEYTTGMVRAFSKERTIIIGDRLDADILGANRFGIDSCWFNPKGLPNTSEALPTCEVESLPAVVPALSALAVV